MEKFNLIIPLTRCEVYKNGRRTINPRTGEVLEDVVASRPIFKAVSADAWDEVSTRGARVATEGDIDGKKRSAARARKQLFQLAACNELEWFVTITLDPKEIARYDYKTVIKKMGQWLDNLVRRHGFAYIIVPELHKDGAIHFHGLVKGDGLTILPAGRRDKKRRPIYNVVNWRYGFTTAVKVKSGYDNVCKYITKYIGKDMQEGTIGGRYYFHGGDLVKPWYVYYDADESKTEGKVVEIEEAGLKLCYVSTK